MVKAPVGYRRTGECQRCGNCCRMDYMDPVKFTKFSAIVSRNHGMRLDPYCANFEWDEEGKGQCKIYDSRKPGCKEFPISIRDIRRARCNGFKFRRNRNRGR